MEWRERLINNLFTTITKDVEDEKGYLEQDEMLYTFGPIDFFTTLDQALSSISQCGQKDVSISSTHFNNSKTVSLWNKYHTPLDKHWWITRKICWRELEVSNHMF